MLLLVPLFSALVPLLILPGVVAYFDVTPKLAILLLGTALIALYRAQNVRNIAGLLGSKIGRAWVAVLALQWISSAIATIFSSHRALSLNGSIWRRFGLLTETSLLLFALLASAWLAANRKNIRLLLRACAAAGAVASIYGIAQYFGWDPLLSATSYQAGEGPFTIVRPPGTLGHADYFAAWLLMIAFLSLALERLEQNKWAKSAAYSTTALAAIAIILSGTRSAILGLIIGLIAFTIAGRLRIRARPTASALACVAALIVFFFSPAGSKLRARAHWSLDDVRGGARLLLWRDSFAMAMHRPLAGFGPETFVTEFPRFESVDLAHAYPDFYHESPHNMFLDPLTTRGLFGLLSIAALCVFGISVALRLLGTRHPLGAPLAAALAAILIAAQFSVFIVPTALYFYLLLGILAAANTAEQTAPTRSRWYLPVAATAAIVFAAFAIQLVAADAALARVDRHIQSGDAAGAAQAYQMVLRFEPAGDGSSLRYSRAMQQLSARVPLFATTLLARQEAFQSGIAATRDSEDRQNAWYNLATLFAANNDASSVERSLRNAIAWAPNWFKPHWTLAQLLQALNQHDQALAEAAIAVKLDAGHDPEVTEALRQLQNRH